MDPRVSFLVLGLNINIKEESFFKKRLEIVALGGEYTEAAYKWRKWIKDEEKERFSATIQQFTLILFW